MSIWQRIQRWWLGSRQTRTYSYTLDEPLSLTLTHSATQENRYQKETTGTVLAAGLTQRKDDELHRRWLSLSPREQDVTALTCLGYTNRQIAFRLGISAGTVKSYLQNVLYKFGLHSKTDLRLVFVDWDFSAWDDPQR
jgi:DNA-binding NarL/FixJ family response regulator